MTDPKAATLIVLVQDRTGKPVEGVGVRLLSGEGQPPRAVSDAHGEVRFTSTDTVLQVLQVIVDDPARPATLLTASDLQAGTTRREVIELLDATMVAGTVRDGAGLPIAGATIDIMPFSTVVPPTTRTDADGHFAAVLTAGEWRIKAAKAGKSDTWQTLEIPAGQPAAAVTINVPDAASLTVTTDCKSKGCLGASVTVSLANNGYTQYLDKSGASTFTDLVIGDAVVTVRDDADPRHPIFGEAKVVLAAGTVAKVAIATTALDASASVVGVLVDADGKQVATGARGQLVVDVEFRGFDRRVIAAADGSFTVPNLVPGECTLTGLRVDPNDPMSGANGGRTTTTVVAPATGVKVKVNDFFR